MHAILLSGEAIEGQVSSSAGDPLIGISLSSFRNNNPSKANEASTGTDGCISNAGVEGEATGWIGGHCQ